MFFDFFSAQIFKPRRHQKVLLAVSFFLFWLVFPLPAATEIVDSIAAVVNDDIITLSDLKIVAALGLFEIEPLSDADVYAQILEKLINQKLAIGQTGSEISVSREEIERIMEEVKMEKQPRVFEAVLDRFGLEREDVFGYIQERLLYEKIIDDRFGLAVAIRLADIESYYLKTYIPQQESAGLEPKPLLDVLNQIESAIRKEKIETQVGEWLGGLKREADIQILFQRRDIK